MSSIGPLLPPHLTKRKRIPDAEDDDNVSSSSNKHPRRDDSSKNHDEIDLDDSDSDSDAMGPKVPTAAPARVSGPSRPITGPSLPPNNNDDNNKDEINLSSDSDSDSDSGPAPPPPPQAAEPESSDSEDDFGPSLPSASAPRTRTIGPSLPPVNTDEAPKRDEWMLAPPPSSTTFSERDTTRIRARKFSSKPSSGAASAAAAGVPSIWTETPEEKLRRLQDSVLGRRAGPDDAGNQPLDAAAAERVRKKEERDRHIAASIEAQRGKSLLEEHQNRRDGGGGGGSSGKTRKGDEEEEDDPSKRAFDREKDMALGGKINTTQRRELINKSANFGGRFQKGSYL